jgi:hypothetical protein
VNANLRRAFVSAVTIVAFGLGSATAASASTQAVQHAVRVVPAQTTMPSGISNCLEQTVFGELQNTLANTPVILFPIGTVEINQTWVANTNYYVALGESCAGMVTCPLAPAFGELQNTLANTPVTLFPIGTVEINQTWVSYTNTYVAQLEGCV